jgi:soluble lytic murein transglycosylase
MRGFWKQNHIGRSLLLLGLALSITGCGGRNADAADATPAAVVPTFTPTPVHRSESTPTPTLAEVTGDPVTNAQPAQPAPATAPPASEPVLLPTATPAGAEAATPTTTPTAALAASERLAAGLRLHRYGDYAAARSEFSAVVNTTDADIRTRLQARYELARTYLAEGASGEALATLDLLDQDLSTAGADPNEFAIKEQYLRAEAHMGQQQYSQAVAAYWRFLEAYPWMAEVVQARIAAAYQGLGDRTSAATAYRRAADATADTVARVQLLEDLALNQSGAGNYAAAVAVYDEILAVAQNAGYRAQIQYLAGQALASAGDLPAATARWRAATDEAPATRAAHSALVEIVNRNIDFDLYQRGYIDLMVEEYLPAINAYQAYLDSVDATDSRYGQALLELGQSYLGAKNYGEALTRFERVIAEFPACDCFGRAWLDKAAAQNGLGDTVGAHRTYRTFAREHVADPLAAEALWRSGIQAVREGNQVEAATDLLTLADGFPSSERAPAALYTVALGAMQSGLHAQAVELYTRLQRDYSQYKWDAVAYWLGRAYQGRGDSSAAQGQWRTLVETAPDIYYGILAGYALRQQALTGGSILAAMPSLAGPPSRLPGDDGSQAFAERWLNDWLQVAGGNLSALPAEVAADQDLRMARLLMELDQRGLALVLLERVFARNRDLPRALYPLSLEFERIGAYRLSIMAMTRLLEFSPAKLVEDAPIFLQQHSYPRHFRELIERAATVHRLNPLLYYSLIRQESLFEEGARSSAVAQGLAQIIPATGQWIAEQLGHPDYTNEIIYRPQINVHFGAYYLDRVRRDYGDGNLISALVGYNAGPFNIAGWRAISGPDDALFVEILNVNEPRLYVQLVIGNLYHYTRLYG